MGVTHVCERLRRTNTKSISNIQSFWVAPNPADHDGMTGFAAGKVTKEPFTIISGAMFCAVPKRGYRIRDDGLDLELADNATDWACCINDHHRNRLPEDASAKLKPLLTAKDGIGITRLNRQ
jgi:hypothetical protein